MSGFDLDKKIGIYKKYRISRDDPDQKHINCFYYVLDLNHDKFSIPAIAAYIAACEGEYPLLAADLRKKLEQSMIAFNWTGDNDGGKH